MKKQYEARVHINPNQDDVEYIGTVRDNSIKGLKDAARKLARSWNKHLSGRLHLRIEEIDREFFINPNI